MFSLLKSLICQISTEGNEDKDVILVYCAVNARNIGGDSEESAM